MMKTQFRKRYRALRKEHVRSLSTDARQRAGEDIADRIEENLPGGLPAVISGYDVMGSELDIAPALNRWKFNGIRIAFPTFDPSGDVMTFVCDGEPVDVELILAPLIAADRSGRRLGQGGGHYDRAIAAIRAKRPVTVVGMAWPCQIAEALMSDRWDEPLDFLVTPEEWIACR